MNIAKNRKVIWLILLVMALSIFASCAEANKSTGDSDTELTDETNEEVTEDPAKPNLPDQKFDGANFIMASRDDSMHSYALHTRDLYAESITGDLMNDAVFIRNQKIAEQYNVNFVLNTANEVTSEATMVTAVEKAVAANLYEYDLLFVHMIYGAASVMKGYYLNWNDVPYIDTSKPYWAQGANEGYSVGDKLLLALSDLSVSSNDCTHCMLFNKKLHDEYEIEDIYKLVNDNKWTFDKFRALTKNISSDLNGDGKFTDKDQYGYFIAGNSGQLNFLWAGGSQVCSHDENNYPFLDMMNDRTIQIYDFLYELRYSDDAYNYAYWEREFCYNFFSEDKALFMSTQIGVINNLRNMDTDFGIIPYPKLNEAQEKYGHYVDGHASLMALPKTVESEERTGIIIEALSYDSYKNLLPIYYNTIITDKLTRDEESGEMLKIIYNSRVFDFAYTYDDWRLAFAFSNMIDAKNANFASFYAKNEKAELKRIEQVIKVYDELDL